MHDIKTIKEIAEMMKKNDIVDVILEDGEKKLILSRAKEQVAVTSAQAPVYIPQPQAVAAPQSPAQQTVAAQPASNFKEVKSPMVGSFYRASSPTATPFVEVGQKVKAGEVLCIIEAMKLMNEIKSDIAGEIVEVCVENGSPVEFGQVLFRVK